MTVTSAFEFYGLGVAWCIAHLAVYIAVLRDRPGFYGEQQIFLYHLCSFLAYSGLALILAIMTFEARAVIVAIALIAFHGIYSISLLEIWSLAQGSYSLGVLNGVASYPEISGTKIVQAFATVGDSKKGDRFAGLAKLGLLTHDGNQWALTPRGRQVTAGLVLLRWLPNLKNTG